MSDKQTEPTVTESDLMKSVESLMALLDSEGPAEEKVEEVVEKSMNHLGTLGGLADEVGAPPLNPELEMGGVEQEELGGDEEDHDALNREALAQNMKMEPVEDEKMKKSEAAEEAPAAEEVPAAEVASDEGDEFAKSLAAAFAEQEPVIDAAASSEFAKSLVLGTIEGLSIAHEEFSKSLSELEARNNEKIVVLAKSLAAIAKAVDEIRSEVVKVSNAPARPMAKSVQAGVQVLEKSFGGAAPVDPVLFKSKVMSALEARVQQGKISAFDLVRYETTGVLDPALAKDIQSELGL